MLVDKMLDVFDSYVRARDEEITREILVFGGRVVEVGIDRASFKGIEVFENADLVYVLLTLIATGEGYRSIVTGIYDHF